MCRRPRHWEYLTRKRNKDSTDAHKWDTETNSCLLLWLRRVREDQASALSPLFHILLCSCNTGLMFLTSHSAPGGENYLKARYIWARRVLRIQMSTYAESHIRGVFGLSMNSSSCRALMGFCIRHSVNYVGQKQRCTSLHLKTKHLFRYHNSVVHTWYMTIGLLYVFTF